MSMPREPDAKPAARRGMDQQHAQAERARLQNLLDSYESDRRNQRTQDEQRGIARGFTPDRADKVRARIARLDQLIADST
jgi:hypothetical protein